MCVVDERRLIVVLAGPEACNRNINDLCVNSVKIALYNMVTTEVEELWSTGFLESGGWMDMLDLLGPGQSRDSAWVQHRWELSNSYSARTKFHTQMAKLPMCSQRGRRVFMCLMSRRAGLTPSPLLDPELFHYEDCLGIAVGRPRPYSNK